MFWRCFLKNINVDVFDNVLENTKHRANDASNDVNRPPLVPYGAGPHCEEREEGKDVPSLPIDSDSLCLISFLLKV